MNQKLVIISKSETRDPLTPLSTTTNIERENHNSLETKERKHETQGKS